MAGRIKSKAEPAPGRRGGPPERIVAEIEALLRRLVVASPATPLEGEALLAAARDAWASRRRRDEIFGRSLFGDLSWDILLHLFVSRLEGKKVSISALAAAAPAPMTTMHRHIGQLVSHGLVSKAPHPEDRRSSHVDLTDEAAEKMRQVFGGG